jgi:hypothetical protein
MVSGLDFARAPRRAPLTAVIIIIIIYFFQYNVHTNQVLMPLTRCSAEIIEYVLRFITCWGILRPGEYGFRHAFFVDRQ